MGASYPLINDEISDLFPLFGGPIYPQSILINQAGVVVYTRLGLFENEIISLIESSLGVTSTVADQLENLNTPSRFDLSMPYPNPFNPSVQFNITLTETQTLEIQIFDVQGRFVKIFEPNRFTAGSHLIKWDAEGNPSGTYLIRVSNGISQQIRRVLLIR